MVYYGGRGRTYGERVPRVLRGGSAPGTPLIVISLTRCPNRRWLSPTSLCFADSAVVARRQWRFPPMRYSVL